MPRMTQVKFKENGKVAFIHPADARKYIARGEAEEVRPDGRAKPSRRSSAKPKAQPVEAAAAPADKADD